MVLSPNMPHKLSHTNASVSTGKDVEASVLWQDPLLRQEPGLMPEWICHHDLSSSMSFHIWHLFTYILWLNKEFQRCRWGLESIPQSLWGMQNSFDIQSYTELGTDPEISVGNMPFTSRTAGLKIPRSSPTPSYSVRCPLSSDLLKLLSFSCIRVSSYWYLVYWSHFLLHTIHQETVYKEFIQPCNIQPFNLMNISEKLVF